LVAVGEGKVSTDALTTELAALKGIRRRRHKKLDLPVPDKAEGWFALRSTDMFRFRVPGNPRAGARAKAPLAQPNFNTPVAVSPEGVVPGDRLVGIMEPEAPITVYPIHSDALVSMHDSDVAWIDVRWDVTGREDGNHKVVIAMLALNKPGTLAQVSSAIAACEANIHNLSMRTGSPDFHKFIFEIEVRDLAQLTDVMATLKLTPGLSDVHRATPAEANALSKIDWSADEPERMPA